MTKESVRALNFLKVLALLIPVPLLTASLYFFGKSYIDRYNELWSLHNIGLENTFIDLVYSGFILLLGVFSKTVIYASLAVLLIIFFAMILRMLWTISQERKKSKSFGNESDKEDDIENFGIYILSMCLIALIPVFIFVVLVSFINARDLAEKHVKETKRELDTFFGLERNFSADFSYKLSKHVASYEKFTFKSSKEAIEGYVVACSASFCVIYVGVDQLTKIPVNSIENRKIILSQS